MEPLQQDSQPGGEIEFSWKRDRREKWSRLERHLKTYYHAPDVEGVRIVIAATAAHFIYPDRNPVWLFIIGASGTGKTSLVGSALSAFPHYKALSNLSPQTFMSGLQLGNKKNFGLLERLGPQIVFWISDLSSITSMREDGRATVMAQLREIYDGELHKDYGNGKEEMWRGKATVMAGTTQAVERQWSLNRDLGERFLNLRWQHGSPEDLAVASVGIANEKEMRMESTHLTREWLGDMIALRDVAPIISEAEIREANLHRLAATVAQLRVSVMRDPRNTSNILDIGQAEGPGRIMNTLALISSSHAALMGRRRLIEEDIQLARRVGRETLPGARANVIDILAARNTGMSAHDVAARAAERGWGVSLSIVRNYLEDLVAIGALAAREYSGQKWYSFTPWFEERRDLLGWNKNEADTEG